ncbi:hypothetical protein [Mesorhizobium sp. GbtcB19]|nr:hypothetical protein [Mesorhizobium sp. GbtcB19]
MKSIRWAGQVLEAAAAAQARRQLAQAAPEVFQAAEVVVAVPQSQVERLA